MGGHLMQKDSTRVFVGILAGVALVAALSVPGYAHHGWGGNEEQETTLTGTLETPVSLAGPHATMKHEAAHQRPRLKSERRSR